MSDESTVFVCRCEDVTLEEIEKAIEAGYKELGDLKRLLRCGMGACQGINCMRQIAQILSQKTSRPIDELAFPTTRLPIRPIPLGIFAQKKLKEERSSKTKKAKEFKKVNRHQSGNS
jgi:bacterioferritin-associated ferredoxin